MKTDYCVPLLLLVGYCTVSAQMRNTNTDTNATQFDPLLAAGEQAFAGSYKLDDALLGPGKVVLLPGSILEGMGYTLEQAATNGILTSGQETTLQQNCVMEVLADHTFAISNLPAADFSRNVSFKGNWSLTVYHVFETFGYRISMKGGPKGDLVLAKYFSADKPEPPVIDILYQEGQLGQITFRFAKTNTPSLLKPRKAGSTVLERLLQMRQREATNNNPSSTNP
jgi:hypothetical protein